jgi:hypothetical protein
MVQLIPVEKELCSGAGTLYMAESKETHCSAECQRCKQINDGKKPGDEIELTTR